jgi:IS5 family transposase
MRDRIQPQMTIDYKPSSLAITSQYYAKYEAISQVLDENPEILEHVHGDLKRALEMRPRRASSIRSCRYTSDTVLRILVCQVIENEPLRRIVVRIDDSHFLRRFVRIDDGPMMDFTTLCRLGNQVRPETWQQINALLTASALEAGAIEGNALRLDTTAVETNIHWPTDSSLLWDVYRVMARWMRAARAIDPDTIGERRLQDRVVKRIAGWITRKAGKKRDGGAAVKSRYAALIGHVEHLLEWAGEVAVELSAGIQAGTYTVEGVWQAEVLLEHWRYYEEVGGQVVSQAWRRVFAGEKLSAEEKIYSIFEPHTELLLRGKAHKPVEFGHMVLVQQVEGKFITNYQVFARRPSEPELVDAAIETHWDQFGVLPRLLAADKGFYRSMEDIRALEESIEIVSIAKKGKRTRADTAREHSLAFKAGQRFRAGVEGSISCLKRALGLGRCLRRGWERFDATIGLAVFVSLRKESEGLKRVF